MNRPSSRRTHSDIDTPISLNRYPIRAKTRRPLAPSIFVGKDEGAQQGVCVFGVSDMAKAKKLIK